jgi:hypothetical protein
MAPEDVQAQPYLPDSALGLANALQAHDILPRAVKE